MKGGEEDGGMGREEGKGRADPIRFHARPTRPAGAGVVPD